MSADTGVIVTISANAANPANPWKRAGEWHRQYQGYITYRISRDSGTALVLADPDGYRYRMQSQQDTNAARLRMSPVWCDVVVAAMINATDSYEHRRHTAIGVSPAARRFAILESFPGYTALRDYLVHELGAGYVVACAAAFRHAAYHARLSDECEQRMYTYRQLGERGWL